MPRSENQPRREPRPESKPATFLDLKPVMSAIDRLVPAQNPTSYSDMTHLAPVDELREFSVQRFIYEENWGTEIAIRMSTSRFDLGPDVEEIEIWRMIEHDGKIQADRLKSINQPNEDSLGDCGCPTDDTRAKNISLQFQMGLNIVSKEDSQKMAQMLNRTTPLS
jgi:hypothetical protein